MDETSTARLRTAFAKPDLFHYRNPPVVMSMVDMRLQLGDVLGRAFHRASMTNVTKNGQPYAAVCHPDDAAVIDALAEAGIAVPDLMRLLANAKPA